MLFPLLFSLVESLPPAPARFDSVSVSMPAAIPKAKFCQCHLLLKARHFCCRGKLNEVFQLLRLFLKFLPLHVPSPLSCLLVGERRFPKLVQFISGFLAFLSSASAFLQLGVAKLLLARSSWSTWLTLSALFFPSRLLSRG